MSQSITAKIRENTADILKQEGRPLAIREVSGRMRQMYERVVRESSDLLNQVDIIDISEEEMQQIMTMRDVIRETKSLIGKIEQCCI